TSDDRINTVRQRRPPLRRPAFLAGLRPLFLVVFSGLTTALARFWADLALALLAFFGAALTFRAAFPEVFLARDGAFTAAAFFGDFFCVSRAVAAFVEAAPPTPAGLAKIRSIAAVTSSIG